MALKTIARKTPEPRGTLKPQWNIIPDGTITHYCPHTTTLDTNTRKNTVIRKYDLAIVTETKPRETTEKPRLFHMVACKTVGEFKIQIKKFCLEEKANKAREEEEKTKHARANNPLQPTPTQQRNTTNRNQMGHEEVVALAQRNQKEKKRSWVTRPAKKQPKTTPALRPTSPGTNTRPNGSKMHARCTQALRKTRASLHLIQQI